MQPPPSLVVLAAGVGSRYGGMKQLAEVSPGGHALMDYAVYDARRAGFGSVVLIVSDQTEEAVRQHAEAGFARAVEVHFARQDSGNRRKPWGTGHAVLSSQPYVEGAFGVVNADDFYGRRSFEILGEGLAEVDEAHVLVGYTLRQTLSSFGGVSRGLCLVDGDRLRSVVELHDVRAEGDVVTSRDPEWSRLDGDETVSTNLWGFRPGFYDVLAEEFTAFRSQLGADDSAEFLIGTAVNVVVERGPGVRVLRTPDRFFGMTYREDRPDVQQQLGALIAEGVYPERLWDSTP